MGKSSRFLHLGRIFWNYRVTRRTRLPHPPLRLWIESTNACNLRCVMCPTSLPEAPKRGFMDFALYAKIVDEAAAFAYDTNLHHRGEAVLHPELPRMIRYAHERGLRTMLHTNGTLLDAGKAREIVASGLDYLSFSFDGFERETYEKIRVRASFEQTVANIEGFLREKQARGSRTPYTVIEVINFAGRGNADRGAQERFVQRFAGLPLDEVRIKEPHNWAGTVPEGQGADTRHFVPCTFPWFALVVFWDGTVVTCPQDFYGAYPVGDVRTSTPAGDLERRAAAATARRHARPGDLGLQGLRRVRLRPPPDVPRRADPEPQALPRRNRRRLRAQGARTGRGEALMTAPGRDGRPVSTAELQRSLQASGASPLAKYQDLFVGSRSLWRLFLYETLLLASGAPGAAGFALRKLCFRPLLGRARPRHRLRAQRRAAPPGQDLHRRERGHRRQRRARRQGRRATRGSRSATAR